MAREPWRMGLPEVGMYGGRNRKSLMLNKQSDVVDNDQDVPLHR